jgi:uncharacterized membrane protein (DUF2068 family)
MTDPKPHKTSWHHKHRHHNSWLVLISAFKLIQGVLFLAIGVGALRLLRKDVGAELMRLLDHLHFAEPWLVNFLLEKSELLNDKLLARIGAAGFIYAALDFAEGIGLYLEKVWAEYLTLFITASFLPWEVLEVIHRQTIFRMGLLAVNALVFAYLLKLVSARRRQAQQSTPAQ